MISARLWQRGLACGAIALVVAHGAMAAPGEGAPIDDAALQSIRDSLEAQVRRLKEQEQALEQQRRELDEQRRKLSELERQLGGAPKTPAAPAAAAPAAAAPAAAAKEPAVASAATTKPQQSEQRPAVNLLADVGGVLTPKGRFAIEPEFEYAYDTQNRFYFNGVEVIDSILVGQIQITDAQRRTFTNALNMRYGLTNRLEIDTRIPFVYRDDELTRQEVSTGNQRKDSLDNANLGDVEFGVHYQINRGQGGWPFFVGNLRVKSDTGEGSFDVDPDDEVATGSGFWAMEPSLTVIYPTDPAVLFANVGYVYSFGDDVNKTYTAEGGTRTRIGKVQPGGSLRASFGVGVALNDALSLSLGYEHNWIDGTDQDFEVAAAGDPFGPTEKDKSDDFQAGSLLFGLSFTISDNVGLNVNVAAGVTEDAPDTRISVRVPISFGLFD